MKPRAPRDPQRAGDLIGTVLSDLGLEAAAGVLRIAERWEAIVGPEVARHCQPMALRGRVLEATVDTSVWCQQLQLRSREILAALRRELGAEAPTELWLRVG
jgi:predicted nucleic acid-binding Zn ribbon protein